MTFTGSVSVGKQLMKLAAEGMKKVSFELVAIDGSAGGFTDPFDVAAVLAEAIAGIEGLERSRMLLFGGCASASRDAGVTMQMVAERLDIVDQFNTGLRQQR